MAATGALRYEVGAGGGEEGGNVGDAGEGMGDGA